MSMKNHRITLEDGEFADEFHKQEKARAMKELEKAESFVLITKIGEHNDCISAIQEHHTKFMAFNCHLAEQGIIQTVKENEEIE